MLQVGMVACLQYLLLRSISMAGLYMLEKQIILIFFFFRTHSAGLLTLAGCLGSCGSGEAATWLCKH